MADITLSYGFLGGPLLEAAMTPSEFLALPLGTLSGPLIGPVVGAGTTPDWETPKFYQGGCA